MKWLVWVTSMNYHIVHKKGQDGKSKGEDQVQSLSKNQSFL